MDFKSTATQSVTTNQHPNAACSATSNERKGLTPTRLKYKLVLSDCNKEARKHRHQTRKRPVSCKLFLDCRDYIIRNVGRRINTRSLAARVELPLSLCGKRLNRTYGKIAHDEIARKTPIDQSQTSASSWSSRLETTIRILPYLPCWKDTVKFINRQPCSIFF